ELVTINPTTGKVIKKYPLMTDKQADEAVEKCHQAFLEWRMVSHKERGKIIKAIGKELKENAEELSKLMTNEMGKLLKQSKQEIELCAGICDWTAANGPDNLKDEERELPDGGKGIITNSPIGVIYGIQPWNFPVYQVMRYSIANLMAGNGILLKHAENVTGTGLMLQKIYEKAGLPKNLFTVLKITHDQSDKIIKHKLVRGVTLTGSPDAGRAIAKKAGAALKKTVMELGSNDAYIVLEDADINLAVKMCVRGRIYNNGETCVAA
ncbi:MAG TPA: succinate-semialdehyde dehydrogenase, partial [Aequorivita sp.]|nr:succinate-semialdehyde dehydrogenase [Aequorivita sp.]